MESSFVWFDVLVDFVVMPYSWIYILETLIQVLPFTCTHKGDIIFFSQKKYTGKCVSPYNVITTHKHVFLWNKRFGSTNILQYLNLNQFTAYQKFYFILELLKKTHCSSIINKGILKNQQIEMTEYTALPLAGWTDPSDVWWHRSNLWQTSCSQVDGKARTTNKTANLNYNEKIFLF